MQGSESTDDRTAAMRQHIEQMLQQARQECRDDIGRISDPKAQALFETTAEALGGLCKALNGLPAGSEAVLADREPMKERTMGGHSSALLVSILPTTPPCSSERKAVRSPWSAVAHHLRSGPKCYWLCHCMRKSPQRQHKSDNDKQGAGVSCQITTKRCLQQNNARH